MDDRKHDAAWHNIPSPFDADGHLTRETADRLADMELTAEDEQRMADVRRRVLNYAVAPWWQRAWWRVTGGPR